jgi:hypothetical protein
VQPGLDRRVAAVLPERVLAMSGTMIWRCSEIAAAQDPKRISAG